MLQDETISVYMEKVIQRIENENKRSRKFLYPSSFQKVKHNQKLKIINTNPTSHWILIRHNLKEMPIKNYL